MNVTMDQQTAPITTNGNASNKAYSIARERITRYVACLTLFAQSPYQRPKTFSWDAFPFPDEWAELSNAGFVEGNLGTVELSDEFPKGTFVLSCTRITFSGIMKLADLTEYAERVRHAEPGR